MVKDAEDIDYIPEGLFAEMVKRLPIASVDAVIVVDGALLLLKRNNSPAKGEWWLPGGRIRRGESLEETVRREVKEETGLEVSSQRLIGVYSRVFPERHDITVAFLCECKKGKVALNDEHCEYAFFEVTPKGLHPYLLETLRDSKWKKARSVR